MTTAHRARILLLSVALLMLPVAQAVPAGVHAGRGQATSPPVCAEPFPLDDVVPGLTAVGWTVARGTEPTTFDVEVLGVLPDAIAGGKDLIVFRSSGDVIDEVGGIWSGMSGSPLYIGERLLGVVSWGFTSLSPIAAATPAEDLLAMAPAFADAAGRREVRLDAGLARVAGLSETDDPVMRPLRIPVGVSGAASNLTSVRKALRREGMRAIPFATSSAPMTSADTAIGPGDSVAAVFSYGDVTIAGIGTASWACGDTVLALGHSLYEFWPIGDSAFGMSEAPVMGVLENPAWGAFKLATIGSTVGTFTHDGWSGIAGTTAAMPLIIPVTATTLDEDTGATGEANTDVVRPEELFYIAGATVASNMSVTADRAGPGEAEVSFSLSGVRETGESFTLERSSVYASDWGIEDEATWELTEYIDEIYRNPFEDVTLTAVDVDVRMRREVARYKLGPIRFSVEGSAYEKLSELVVAPKDEIRVRISLRDRSGAIVDHVDAVIEIPLDAKRGGSFEVVAGDEVETPHARTFDELIAALRDRPCGNDLIVRLVKGTRGEGPFQELELDHPVSGYRSWPLIVER
jgi:hypothetical protein